MAEKEPKRPFDVALDYLTKCARSEKEVKDKLYKKGYTTDEINDTLSKLKEYHFIDDKEYIKTFLSFYKSKFGEKQLEMKLTLIKGVDKELVKEVLSEQLDENEEIEKATNFAKKYFTQKKLDFSRENVAKVGNWLYGKGFNWRVIGKAMSNLKIEIEENE